MAIDKPLEAYSMSKVLPAIMTFLGKVAKDDTSAHADEARELQADLLMTAILGIGKAVGNSELSERAAGEVRTALADNGHDPYNGRS